MIGGFWWMLEKFSKKPNSMWQCHLSLVQKRDLGKFRDSSCARTQGYGTKGLGVALWERNLRAMWLQGRSKGGSSALTPSRGQHVIPEGAAEHWPYCLSSLFSCGYRTEVWGLRAQCSSTSFPPLTCSCQSLCSEAKVQRCIFPRSCLAAPVAEGRGWEPTCGQNAHKRLNTHMHIHTHTSLKLSSHR